MQTLSIRLGSPTYERVEAYAEEIDDSLSVAGRELLQEGIRHRVLQDEQKEAGTVTLNAPVASTLLGGALAIGAFADVSHQVGAFGLGIVVSATLYALYARYRGS